MQNAISSGIWLVLQLMRHTDLPKGLVILGASDKVLPISGDHRRDLSS